MLLFLMFAAFISSPVSLDHIVAAVGLDAITETQVNEEVAVTELLNREPLHVDQASRRAAAERLIEQTLIRHEMHVAHFPEPEQSNVNQALASVIAQFGGRGAFAHELETHGVSEQTLRNHLETQALTLSFIEYRFRPELSISERELHAEYDRRTSDWDRQHPGTPKPSFEKSRDELRYELIEQRTDQAMTDWLRQTGAQTRITYYDPALEPAK